MGTEKNAEQRSIDEKERLERERWEREMREQERQMLDEEWETERSRAGDWERAKEAILAGTAVIEEHHCSYFWLIRGAARNCGLVVALGERPKCRVYYGDDSHSKKPLWDKTMPLSEEDVERFRTTCASIVLPQRKHKPDHFETACDGGCGTYSVRAGRKTLFSLRRDTSRMPFGDEQWQAEKKAEEEALEPCRELLREFWKKCDPPEGELERIAREREEREEAARERKRRKEAGD